jgi:predicted ATPase
MGAGVLTSVVGMGWRAIQRRGGGGQGGAGRVIETRSRARLLSLQKRSDIGLMGMRDISSGIRAQSMLTHLTARGLNGRVSVDTDLYPDINLITGSNGSGKTTILKLLWYSMSGNIERIAQEIKFDFVDIKSTKFSMSFERKNDLVIINYKIGKSRNKKIECSVEHMAEEIPPIYEMNHAIADVGQSVFFPTFRRVEGGFSIGTPHLRPRRGYVRDLGAGIQEALERLAGALSVGQHRFVCSISTSDIVNLVTKRYADVSQSTNLAHSKLVGSIIKDIDNLDVTDFGQKLDAALDVIHRIRDITQEFKINQEHILAPFSALSDTISKLFVDKRIKITESVFLGDELESIPSDMLSAGEKQVLSFLVYNAFYSKVPFFIDEPELSLHVDWQRALFGILDRQKTGNQFFIATHSPFIYASYKDREILVGKNRGGE